MVLIGMSDRDRAWLGMAAAILGGASLLPACGGGGAELEPGNQAACDQVAEVGAALADAQEARPADQFGANLKLLTEIDDLDLDLGEGVEDAKLGAALALLFLANESDGAMSLDQQLLAAADACDQLGYRFEGRTADAFGL